VPVLSLVQETLADLHGLLDDAYKEDLLRAAAEFMSGKVQASEQRDLQLLQDALTPDVGCTVVQQHIMKVPRVMGLKVSEGLKVMGWTASRECSTSLAQETRVRFSEDIAKAGSQPLKHTRRRYRESSSKPRSAAQHKQILARGLNDIQRIADGMSKMLSCKYCLVILDERHQEVYDATSQSVAGIVQAVRFGEAMIGWSAMRGVPI
jgi:hypothetical protein